MKGTAKWIASGIVGILGIVGLFLAASALDPGIYVFGLGLAAFSVTYISAQLKQSFDAVTHIVTTTPDSRKGFAQ